MTIPQPIWRFFQLVISTTIYIFAQISGFMKKTNFKVASVAVAALFLGSLSSCSNKGAEEGGEKKDTTLADSKRIDSLSAQKKQDIDFKFATLEANIPSPFSLINDMKGHNVPFKKELLNPDGNLSKYTSAYKKEVNFGVYGVDLAYINFYGQNQDMMKYFNNIQKLSEDLNLDKVFEVYASRFKSNSDNHDSVIAIVDNVFSATDGYLNKNDRYLVASHVIAGSIIETNYLSLSLLKDMKKGADNEKFFEKVFNENLAIYHLINLFEKYTDKDSKDLLANMKTYKAAYESTIKSVNDLTPENISKAVGLIGTLRDKVIK